MPEASERGETENVSTEADTDPLIGRVVNERYTITSPIGQGGMGRVYKAIQAPLDRVVALKVLSTSFPQAADPAFVKRFFLEASVTSKLTHPNTVTIYDYGRTKDGIFYIAMEYLEGGTLSRELHGGGKLAPARVVRIAMQIARSLREAHRSGIIHRDLKPANIALLQRGDEEDVVKVLDFGLVKFFGEQDLELTNQGTFMGSPHYIAPEQARNDGPDPRADVYSLGVLMFHMATGRVPFDGESSIAVVLAHLNDRPRAPRTIDPSIPESLEAVILRCMEKDRTKRYQSMDELVEALVRVAASLGMSTSASRSLPELSLATLDLPVVEEAPAKPARVWRGAALAAGLGLAVAGVIALLLAPPAGAPDLAAPSAGEPKGPAIVAPPPAGPTLAPLAAVLEVTADPPGAEVFEGETRLGAAPLRLERPSGTELRLVLRAKGFEPAELARTLSRPSEAVHVALRKESPQPAPGAKPGSSGPEGYKEDPY